MDENLLLAKLQDLHRRIPTVLQECYTEMHEILDRAGYPNPWLISCEEAVRVLRKDTAQRYQNAALKAESQKREVWDAVVAVFSELKGRVEWYKHRQFSDCGMRHYRARIASGYELEISWNNVLVDPANSIDVRIRGVLDLPVVAKKRYRVLGITVWTTTKRSTYPERFPDFGPTVAGPIEEGPLSSALASEAAKVPDGIRDAVFNLFRELKGKLN